MLTALFSVAYAAPLTMSSIVPERVDLQLSVGQPRRHRYRCRYRVVADQPTMFEMCTCPCRLFCCDRRPAVPAKLAAEQQQQQTLIDEMTPVLERVKFDVAFTHRIVSYCDILCDIDRIVSFSLRAVSCQHYGRVTRAAGPHTYLALPTLSAPLPATQIACFSC